MSAPEITKAQAEAVLHQAEVWTGDGGSIEMASREDAATLLTLARAGAAVMFPSEEADDGWEYATTSGPRKAFYELPPEGDGWVRNTSKGRDGWDRFEYHEEAYWKRRKLAMKP